MSIKVNINEKDGNFECQSTSSFDACHFTNVYSVFNNKAEIIDQYTDDCNFIKDGVAIYSKPAATIKRHFNAHLKEIRLFLGIDKKPEPEEFDGYVVYDNRLRSRIFKAKIKIISDKRFEYKEESFSFWQTVNMNIYSYHKSNPEIDKLYEEYKMTEKRYNLLKKK